MTPRHLLAGLLLATLAAGAAAQLRLPGLPGAGGALERLQPLTAPLRDTTALATEALRERVPLQELRGQTLRELLRRHGDRLEADPAGEAVVRAQLLLLAPRPATLAAALAQGFAVLRDEVQPSLDLRTVVLRTPRGLSAAQALQQLRLIDPEVEADFNHLLLPSGPVAGPAAAAVGAVAGASAVASAGAAVAAGRVVGAAIGAATAAAAAGPARVGLVDSGVDIRHPAFASAGGAAGVQRWGCDGQPVAAEHGTAVASLLLGASAAGTQLLAADVYCGRPEGGNVEAVVQALAWLAREQVGVVNISLVGPPNRVLERSVQALLRRGHAVVAAVGNDGPAAPPLYPAAYPGVLGVTAVNASDTVLPEAARGQHVLLAAPGAALPAARFGSRRHAEVRGTSFAAPLVAALLAAQLPGPDPAAAGLAAAALTGTAVDLGEPGRDAVYGHGLVGARLRAELAALAKR